MSLVRQYLILFWRSWVPAQGSAYARFSLQRVLVLLLFWPLFLLLMAINSLCLALDHVLFPRFRQVQVRQPVFVLGVPRSGTTFLHRLLAGDRERFTTTALWELIFAPSIVQRHFFSALAGIDRLVGGPLAWLLNFIERKALGGLDDIHKTGLLDPEEDYLALAPVLGCFLLILPLGDPSLWTLAYFDVRASAQDKTRIMAYYRRLVQRHLYFHGSHKTFLSKNPSFTPMMAALKETFPDAGMVGCVRNPAQSVPSQVNSILVGARIFSRHVDLDWWRDGLTDMLVDYYRRVLEELPQLSPEAHRVVPMERLSADAAEEVTAIYQALGMQPSILYAEWLRQQAEKNRSYRSAHHYDAGALGISEQALALRFDFVYSALGYPLP